MATEQPYEIKYSTQAILRTFDGEIQAVNKATVSAQTSGVVSEIHYDVDDFVAAGTVLVEFSNTEQKQAVKKAQANVTSAQAIEKQANENYRMIKKTYDQKLISKRDYDQALSQKETASANVIANKAALENAETQLEYTLIKAPYDGIVTARHIETGEVIKNGMPVMSGISLNKLRIITHIPESIVTKIKQISQAHIELSDGSWINSNDMTLFPYADPASKTFEVRVNLPENQNDLYPGMSVKVHFNVGDKEVLLVPNSSIIHRGELILVYVKNKDKQLPRQVKTGREYKGYTEIISGLSEGDFILNNSIKDVQKNLPITQ